MIVPGIDDWDTVDAVMLGGTAGMRTGTADGTLRHLSDSFGRADDARVESDEAGHFTRKSKQRRRTR